MNNINFNEFNGLTFDCEQMAVIRMGLREGVDVSIYAKPEFTAPQMYEILSGIHSGVDVTIYAREEYNLVAMTRIREMLQRAKHPGFRIGMMYSYWKRMDRKWVCSIGSDFEHPTPEQIVKIYDRMQLETSCQRMATVNAGLLARQKMAAYRRSH